MKLHQDFGKAANIITHYDADSISVGRQEYRQSLIVLPEQVLEWPVNQVEQLAFESFAPLLARSPKIILLGTGSRQIFPHPKLIAHLSQQGIGVEVMSTAAACRTYNILMSEDRLVAAALIIETSSDTVKAEATGKGIKV